MGIYRFQAARSTAINACGKQQLLSILQEPIKSDLGASDTAMGLLTGFAFVAFFTLASPPIGRAVDMHSRRNIIGAALASATRRPGLPDNR